MTLPCDCLNICGDDSRVHNGKAAPCDYRRRLIADRAQLLTDVVLLTAFVNSSHNRNVSEALGRVLQKVAP